MYFVPGMGSGRTGVCAVDVEAFSGFECLGREAGGITSGSPSES